MLPFTNAKEFIGMTCADVSIFQVFERTHWSAHPAPKHHLIQYSYQYRYTYYLHRQGVC